LDCRKQEKHKIEYPKAKKVSYALLPFLKIIVPCIFRKPGWQKAIEGKTEICRVK